MTSQSAPTATPPRRQEHSEAAAENTVSSATQVPSGGRYDEHAIQGTDLATIIFAMRKDGRVDELSLDFLSDRTVLAGLRPAHYSYDRFRQWLEEELLVAHDEPAFVTAVDVFGNETRRQV